MYRLSKFSKTNQFYGPVPAECGMTVKGSNADKAPFWNLPTVQPATRLSSSLCANYRLSERIVYTQHTNRSAIFFGKSDGGWTGSPPFTTQRGMSVGWHYVFHFQLIGCNQ
jgi:hypothetical protein